MKWGVDAVRFMMLFRKNGRAAWKVDLARYRASKDNPVFYVQYAHALGNCHYSQALCRLPGARRVGAVLAAAPLELLSDPCEIGLLKLSSSVSTARRGRQCSAQPHASRFFYPCTSLPAVSIPIGTRAKISHNYALLMHKKEFDHARFRPGGLR